LRRLRGGASARDLADRAHDAPRGIVPALGRRTRHGDASGRCCASRFTIAGPRDTASADDAEEMRLLIVGVRDAACWRRWCDEQIRDHRSRARHGDAG
jgi:hypothetical protein